MIKKYLFPILLLLICANPFFAQTKLDKFFGTNGIVSTSIGQNGAIGQSIVIQNDGKVLVAGYSSNQGLYYDFALVRYNNDGTVDKSFGKEGKVMTDIGGFSDYGRSMALQADGKILLAGSSTNGKNSDFALVRYNMDGSIDMEFGKEGKVVTAIGSSNDYAKSIVLQKDGKIVIAGGSYNGTDYDFAVVRYHMNGSLDQTFGLNGKAITDVGGSNDNGESVVMDANGKIVVTGYSFNSADKDIAVVRYNTDGTLDLSFNQCGKVTTDIDDAYNAGNAITIQTDGKIVIAGYSYSSYDHEFVLVRYHANGELDRAFGANGITTTNMGSDGTTAKCVGILPSGKIVVSGYTHNKSDYDFALVQYNSDGTMDTSFGIDGQLITAINSSNDYCNSLAIQPDGKIIVAGSSSSGSDESFSIARYVTSDERALEEKQLIKSAFVIPSSIVD